MIFKGDFIVIPKEMRPEMLMRVHEGHLGIKKCRSLARMALFWPGMNADIEQTIANCGPCQMHCTANTKETLVNHPIPNLPWEMVASDLFTLDGRDYVLVIDYHSNYPEVEHSPDTRSGTVINKIKAILARHRKCLKFVSDDGPQYVSCEFTKFASKWGFEHVTSSPTYPQTAPEEGKRGKEGCVLKSTGATQHTCAWCHVTYTAIDVEAAAIIYPVHQQLRPSITAPSAIVSMLERKQTVQKAYYDKTAKDLPTLHSGKHIRIRTPGPHPLWEPAIVMDNTKTGNTPPPTLSNQNVAVSIAQTGDTY